MKIRTAYVAAALWLGAILPAAAQLPPNNAGTMVPNAPGCTISGGTITCSGSSLTPGTGSVTTVSVVTANGVSGSVANPTTTPAITLSLGAITPTTVNGLTISATTGTLTLASGKVLTVSNTLTFTGTDGSSVAFGTGGTVVYTSSNPVTAAASMTANQLVVGDDGARGVKTANAAITGAYTWSGIQTFTLAPVFTDASGSRTALGLGALATVTPGTGVATALAVNVGSAGAVIVNGGVLGTPSSGVATNLTGTASGLTAGNVTTNANLTGPITSVGNATSIASQTGTGTTFVMSASPTLTGLLTITQSTANAGVVASTGYSVTGSGATNMVDLAGTWNTSGAPYAFKLNITNTASDAAARLLAIQANGINILAVHTAGVNVNSNSTSSSRGLLSGQYNDGAQAAFNVFEKARGTKASSTIITTGDFVGIFASQAYDGAAFQQSAAFGFQSYGTITSGSVPQRLFFGLTSGGAITFSNANYQQTIDVSGVTLKTSIPLQWSSSDSDITAAADLKLTRAAAATLQLGAADVSSGAVAQTVVPQSNTGATTTGPLFLVKGAGGGSGAGSIGGELRLQGGLTAAAGQGGSVTIYVSPSGAGNTPALAMTIANNKVVTMVSSFVATTGILNTLASDATFVTATVCADSTTGQLYKGSGLAGICLGTSSLRYKTDWRPSTEYGLAQVVALNTGNYHYKKGYGDDGARQQYGFAAEEVVKVLPNLVGLDKEGRPNTLDHVGMIPVLVNAIKELKADNDNLRAATMRRAANQ